MPPELLLIIIMVVLTLLSLLAWWLLIETEGVYLGGRIVILLYDLAAGRYDRIKAFDERAELLLLSEPLLDRIIAAREPLILDIATGTGRLPLIVARNARFRGHVIGIDRSRRMLASAAGKVSAQHFADYVSLLRADAMNLPCPDACADAVTCLEALEFLPDWRRSLAQMSRVLRPGGVLLTSLRIDTRWMPGKIPSESALRQALSDLGMIEIAIEDWQSDYRKVWARKSGMSQSQRLC